MTRRLPGKPKWTEEATRLQANYVAARWKADEAWAIYEPLLAKNLIPEGEQASEWTGEDLQIQRTAHELGDAAAAAWKTYRDYIENELA